MGYRLSAMTDHDAAYALAYSGTQLGHGTRASTINSTERDSITLSITLAAIACVVAPRRQVAALHGRNECRRRRSKQSYVFFSDCGRRKQLMLLDSESSLREQDVLAGAATSLTQFPKRCRIPSDRPTRRGSLLLVSWSSNPSSVLVFLLIAHEKCPTPQKSR